VVIEGFAVDGLVWIDSPVESWIMNQFYKTSHGQSLDNPLEQRSCPRYPFSPEVEAVETQASTRITGRLSDIARNGCYMDTICPFAAKADVTLTITRDKQSFKTQAKVVYSQIGMGMGLLFTTAQPEQLRQLGAWLGELAGEKSPEEDTSKLQQQDENKPDSDHGVREILGELISLLSRQSILNDTEAKAMLRKLYK
jgi:hypothetical protein